MNARTGQQFGSYRLLRLLGQGGQASVYLAEHIHLGTQVAVKVLSEKFTMRDVQALANEAQTLVALNHPHILHVRDFGFAQTLPFLVMDYAPGGTLRDRHPSGSIIAFPAVLAYVKQMASALDSLHKSKLIHRDIKPENMLIDAHGNVLLSDFGIATVAHTTASLKTIENIGTVHYMAPELIQGKARAASDQYALAVCVYEWLCGKRPFQGGTPIEIAMRHLSDNPPSLCQRIPSFPAAVEQVVLRALEKDPKIRFPDMAAFSYALEQARQKNTPAQVSISASLTLPSILTLKETASPPILIVAEHGGDYASINEAIKHAQPHTRILVRPGVYVECVTLNKDLCIVGDGPRDHIVLENHSTTCLSMQTEHASVQGITIRSSGGPAVLIPHGKLSLIDCEISATRGIYTTGVIIIEGRTTDPLINNCRVYGNDIPAVQISNYAQGTIEHCTILAAYSWAGEIATGADPAIRCCAIIANAYGIWIRDYGRGTIADCDFTQGNELGALSVEEGCQVRRI